MRDESQFEKGTHRAIGEEEPTVHPVRCWDALGCSVSLLGCSSINSTVYN